VASLAQAVPKLSSKTCNKYPWMVSGKARMFDAVGNVLQAYDQAMPPCVSVSKPIRLSAANQVFAQRKVELRACRRTSAYRRALCPPTTTAAH
jgi:hypothetical protein